MPTSDARTIAEIEAAVRANDLPRAVDLARLALSSGIVHPMLLNLRSYWLLRQGRDEEALADLAHAVRIAPEDLLARNAYGILLGKHLRWREALAILEGSVRLAPNFALAQFSLGWALESTGELTAAWQRYERALVLDPAFVEPMARLANLAYRRADWPSARGYAEKALRLRKNDYVALTVLASVAIAEGDLAQAERLLGQLAVLDAPSELDAALVETARGDLRHGQKRYAEAFEAYAAANHRKFRLFARLHDQPGQTATDYVRWLSDSFGRAAADRSVAGLRSRPNDACDGAIGHAFLVGFPRSGTTLLEAILAAHPQIVTSEERDLLGDAAIALLSDDAGRERLAALGEMEIVAWRTRYWEEVHACGAVVQGKVFVDKYPLTMLKLPLVAKLFPEARILFAVRDPRDVVLSCYRRSFSMNASMFEFLHLDRAARFYDAAMELAQQYRTRLGLAWRDVRHESLVLDFEKEVRGICDFLGVEWTPQLASFAERAKGRSIRTPSSTQVTKGLNSEGMGQWRNYIAQMALVSDVLEKWAELLGYPPGAP